MRCSECAEKRFRESQGELVCLGCGLVLEDNRIEQSTLLSEGSHASHPALAQAGTFNTNGRHLTESWLLTTKQKNFRATCSEIDLLVSRIKAPKTVAAEAKRMFLEVTNKEITIGRSNQAFAYAAVYIACIDAGTPQTALEITAHTEIPKAELLKAAKHIQRALKIRTGTIEAIDLIPRFATRLRLPSNTVTLAIQYAGMNASNGLKPSTLAATSLYVAMQTTGEYRAQRLFTRYTGVVEVTIRRRSKQLRTNSQFR